MNKGYSTFRSVSVPKLLETTGLPRSPITPFSFSLLFCHALCQKDVPAPAWLQTVMQEPFRALQRLWTFHTDP